MIRQAAFSPAVALAIVLSSAVPLAAQTRPLPRECAQPAGSVALARFGRVEGELRAATAIRGVIAQPMRLDERMRYYHVPGVSIALIDGFHVVVACGYGSRATDSAGTLQSRQVTPATLFQAASVSKSVAALAPLELVQDGRLSLDTDVNQWLTTWKIPDNEFTRQHPVTLRTLLSHGAGITVHGFGGYAAGAPVPSLVQVLNGLPPANSEPIRVDKTPGGAWRYSGGGYTVLQQLLIDVTGMPFPQLMRDRVLRPLGMTRSAYDQPLPTRDTAIAASGYRADGTMVPGRYHTHPELAAAGLWTNPSDLARFVIAIEQAALGRPHSILSTPLAHEMLTPQTGDYGLGVAVAGAGRTLHFSHSGANEGFRAYYVGFPATGQGVVVMTNSDAGGELYQEIVRGIAIEYGWPALKPVEREEAPTAAEQLKFLPGHYSLSVGNATLPLDVVARGDTLVARLTGAWAHERVLHRSGGWTYFSVEDPTELTFERDAAGQVTGATVRASGQVLHARRQ
ncbi:MAG: serine hydrolase domain-containing protein [Gemmatimonadaceae bacterium]